MQDRKMQDNKMMDQIARVENIFWSADRPIMLALHFQSTLDFLMTKGADRKSL